MNNLAINYYDHPVFNPRRFHLQTPAMARLSEVVHRWLWTGATGGLINGMSRTGKTTAILSLMQALHTRGNQPIPAYYLSVDDRDKLTIASLFRQLCYSADLRVTDRDPADILSDRYVHYISEQVLENNSETAVLFVDEMQRLVPKQLNVFAELYDKLLQLDTSLTIIFTGNDPECWNLIRLIEEPHYSHIRGRFFINGHEFLGLTNKTDVSLCLSQYDTLRYPEHGLTYTAFFLPEEFQNGWRLASLAGDIWRIFREYKKDYRIKSWGMKYFTIAVNALLSDYLPRYGVDSFGDEMMHECIKVSGLIPSLVKPAS